VTIPEGVEVVVTVILEGAASERVADVDTPLKVLEVWVGKVPEDNTVVDGIEVELEVE